MCVSSSLSLSLPLSLWQLLLKSKMLWLMGCTHCSVPAAELGSVQRPQHLWGASLLKIAPASSYCTSCDDYMSRNLSDSQSSVALGCSWVLFSKHPPNDWLSSFSSFRFPFILPLFFSSRSNNVLSAFLFCRDQTVMKTLRLQRNCCSSTSHWQT